PRPARRRAGPDRGAGRAAAPRPAIVRPGGARAGLRGDGPRGDDRGRPVYRLAPPPARPPGLDRGGAASAGEGLVMPVTVPLPVAACPVPADAAAWPECRFLTCSVLPVRVACNLACPFCFSKSSVSALRGDPVDWRRLDVAGYYAFARERGATRLVITGGGESLLRPDDVVYLAGLGRRYFDEVASFTNGTYLTPALAGR